MLTQPLNGIDHFMLHLDRLARRSGSHNTCHILATFPESITDIRQHLDCIEKLKILSSLRLSGRFYQQWKPRGAPSLDLREVTKPEPLDISSICQQIAIDPLNESPIRFTALQKNGNRILISWHHCLTDALGAEQLLHEIARGSITLPHPKVSESFAWPLKPRPILKKMSAARSFSRYLFELCEQPIQRLAPDSKCPSGRATIRTFRIARSSFENTCQACSADLFPSLVTLAAAGLAAAQLIQSRGAALKPFYVPVPHTIRRHTGRNKGAKNEWLGNNVTFLFFRVDATAHSTLRDLTHSLVTQMHHIFEAGIQRATREFFELARYLPHSVYSRLLMQPGRGTLASFFYSDLGVVHAPFWAPQNLPQAAIQHLPPNISPPGFTIVSHTTESHRHIMLVADTGLLPDTDLEKFEAAMKKLLHTENTQHDNIPHDSARL